MSLDQESSLNILVELDSSGWDDEKLCLRISSAFVILLEVMTLLCCGDLVESLAHCILFVCFDSLIEVGWEEIELEFDYNNGPHSIG